MVVSTLYLITHSPLGLRAYETLGSVSTTKTEIPFLKASKGSEWLIVTLSVVFAIAWMVEVVMLKKRLDEIKNEIFNKCVEEATNLLSTKANFKMKTEDISRLFTPLLTEMDIPNQILFLSNILYRAQRMRNKAQSLLVTIHNSMSQSSDLQTENATRTRTRSKSISSQGKCGMHFRESFLSGTEFSSEYDHPLIKKQKIKRTKVRRGTLDHKGKVSRVRLSGGSIIGHTTPEKATTPIAENESNVSTRSTMNDYTLPGAAVVSNQKDRRTTTFKYQPMGKLDQARRSSVISNNRTDSSKNGGKDDQPIGKGNKRKKSITNLRERTPSPKTESSFPK